MSSELQQGLEEWTRACQGAEATGLCLVPAMALRFWNGDFQETIGQAQSQAALKQVEIDGIPREYADRLDVLRYERAVSSPEQGWEGV